MQTISITAQGKKSPVAKITDRIKTFEDACEALGLEGQIFSGALHDNLSGLSDRAKHLIAGIKLEIIIEALNEKWFPDWNNSSEYKYYPWWTMKGTFSLVYVDGSYAGSNVGSRLCYRTRELANYGATQFADLYKDYFTL